MHRGPTEVACSDPRKQARPPKQIPRQLDSHKLRAIASVIEIVIEMDLLRLKRITKSSEIYVDAKSAT